MNGNAGLIANLLALIPVIMNVIKEKHYVKRGAVSLNGLLLIAVGCALFLTDPYLSIQKIPLGVFLIIWGMVAIYMINTDWSKAQKIGNSRVTLIILIIVALIQSGLIMI